MLIMLRYILITALFCNSMCFMPTSNFPSLNMKIKSKNFCNMKMEDLDTKIFNDIDSDKSGLIDMTELNKYYGKSCRY